MSIYDLPVEPITARGKAAGLALYALSRLGKVKLAEVADKLDIRARILRDIAPAVGMSTTGNALDLPVARQRNLEWAADEIETAGELIRRLSNNVPRTMQDFMNEERVKELDEDVAVLRRALRAKLSPLWVKALDVLDESTGMTAAMLGERIGVSVAQATNICSALHGLGLTEREHVGSSHPDFTGPGRTPWWWSAVRAIREHTDEEVALAALARREAAESDE